MSEAQQHLTATMRALALARKDFESWEKEYRVRKQGIDELVASIRTQAEAMGAGKHAPGIEVRLTKVVKGIESEEMLAWSLENARHLITVKRQEVSKMAEHLASVGAPIVVTAEPKARIASDLSYYLKEDET